MGDSNTTFQHAHLLDAAVGRSDRLAVGTEGEGKRTASDLRGMQSSGSRVRKMFEESDTRE